MDTVADAVLEAHKMAENGDVTLSHQSIDHLENEIALTLIPALVLFGAAAGGLGLVIYFFVNLSDCQEDLINPYTLCERINTKLHWELICHGAAVGALLLEELIDGDRLHWVALLLAAPGLLGAASLASARSSGCSFAGMGTGGRRWRRGDSSAARFLWR